MLRRLYLFLIFFKFSYGNIDIWELETINLEKLTVIKEAPMHTVYKGEDFYLKIWIKDTRPFEYGKDGVFLEESLKGTLKDIAPLKAVIINSDGQCYGYATSICSPIEVNIQHIAASGFKVKSNKEKLVVDLFSRMRDRTLDKGVCFTDLASSNLGILHDQCYFFDLDGFWNLELYKETHKDWSAALFYLDAKFKKES